MAFTKFSPADAKPDDSRFLHVPQGLESGKSKDGNPFVIRVSPGPNGSQGKIEIQDKD